MWFSSWLGKRQRSAASGRSPGSSRKWSSYRPWLEALEDRLVPSGGYHFQTIDDPNAVRGTVAFGINARGQVVGYYTDANSGLHGFVLSGGQYTTLDDPNAGTSPGQGTSPFGINASGRIVGSYFDANGNDRAFLLSGGQYTAIDDPHSTGSFFSEAVGINDRGQIVGAYADPNTGATHGTLLSHGQFTTIDDPNAAFGTYAFGTNDRGQIVGPYLDSNNSFHGYLLSGGQFTTIDDPNAVPGYYAGTNANGINAHGQIVGYYDDASGLVHGFLLSGGRYTTLDDPNAAFATFAFGINDSGTIVGYYVDANFHTHGFLATKVHGDDAPARTSMNDGGASGGSLQVLLPAALTNATLTANQVIHVAGGSGANHTDGLSSISSGPTWDRATVPSALPGSGDNAVGRVNVASAAGRDTGLPGNDVFARNDDVFRVDL
jgi:probable HAF family extracellular repeat protein